MNLTDSQLNEYLQRIHYQGVIQPNLSTLNSLILAHASYIPFENISVLLKQGINIEEQAVFNKLVKQQRGGYCFEQNGLFGRVLNSLGFDCIGIGARVRLAETDREVVPGRTHLLNLVKLDGQYYLADVGVGAASLTQAIAMTPEIEQQTPHDLRRLQFENNKCYHQIWFGDHWQDVYEFTPEPFEPRDQMVASWYTSTSPNSHFTRDLSLAIALDNGQRATVSNRTYKIRQSDGAAELSEIASPEQLQELLGEVFGIKESTENISQLWKLLPVE